MEAARHTLRHPSTGRLTLRPHGAARRHGLRHEPGASPLKRRQQGVRTAPASCRILVRARFDLDTQF